MSHGGSGTDHWYVPEVELLKLQKNGQFPDEFVRIEVAQIHDVSSRRSRNSRHEGYRVRRIVIIVRVIFSNFVSNLLVTYLHH
jgi:hypothetical protein